MADGNNAILIVSAFSFSERPASKGLKASLFNANHANARRGRGGLEIWKKALEKNLEEQNLFNNMVGDGLKAILRIYGWLSLDFLLYGGKLVMRSLNFDDNEFFPQ